MTTMMLLSDQMKDLYASVMGVFATGDFVANTSDSGIINVIAAAANTINNNDTTAYKQTTTIIVVDPLSQCHYQFYCI